MTSLYTLLINNLGEGYSLISYTNTWKVSNLFPDVDNAIKLNNNKLNDNIIHPSDA
jgi:hypothetical protein